MTSSRLFDESGDLLENHTLVLHEPLGFLIFFRNGNTKGETTKIVEEARSGILKRE